MLKIGSTSAVFRFAPSPYTASPYPESGGKEQNMKRGLYRVHGVDGLLNDVLVDDDGIDLPLNEALYRAYGYKPVVEDLPWRDAYRLQQAS
jgi:hypothetical protein